jgi:anti-sigma regulatory factor (Ser/Thr protein kinase)
MAETITIPIKQPIKDDSRMGVSIEVLLDILQIVNNTKKGDSIIFDMTKLDFVYPFLILPISALIQYLNIQGIETSFILPDNANCQGYMNQICFPNGLNPILNDSWESQLNQYNSKTYLPIIAVPVKSKNEQLKNKIIEVFEQIMQKQLNLDINIQTAIKYITGEAFDNIDQHAEVDNGWIMVQNYPTKEFLDVCILETGKGILQSYIDAGFDNIKTHEDALQEATNGLSAKVTEKSRGFGIRTSKRMLVEGLKGKYFLFSGNSFYIWTVDHKNIPLLDEKNFWHGTMLALRIPKTAPSNFNYINYLE